MKLHPTITKFLTNKWVLNFVSLLTLFNIIGYIVLGNTNTIIYFILIAVLVRYFSKNMIIVLGIPLIIVNLLSLRGNIMEGLENPKQEESDKKDQKKIDKMVKDNKNANGGSSTVVPLDNTNSTTTDNSESTGEQQGFEPGRKKNRGYQIDYASTVEDAYDELNSILGSDGIQRLTSDTQSLMKQQMKLAEAMKDMGPVIKQIGPMVENLKGMMGQMGEGKEGLNGIMDLAKKMSG